MATFQLFTRALQFARGTNIVDSLLDEFPLDGIGSLQHCQFLHWKKGNRWAYPCSLIASSHLPRPSTLPLELLSLPHSLVPSNSIWRFGFRFRTPGLKDIHEFNPAFIPAMVTYLVVSKYAKGRIPSGEHLARIFNW